MNWIGQDVACKFGLCGPPGFDRTLAVPSFNCKAAQQPSEIAICSNKRLARHEAQLAKYYFDTLNKMPASERDVFRAEQRAWLKFRDTCKGAEIEKCLLSRMEERWNEVMGKWGETLVKSPRLGGN
jgi:uncharacterized protein